jgi:hypothetical protein
MARRAKISKREPLADLEDLRDDCIGIALETKMSFKDIHEKGGPTPQTSAKWLYRETRFPQLATIRAMLRACDYDLSVTPTEDFEPRRFSHSGITYPQVRKKKAPRRNGTR